MKKLFLFSIFSIFLYSCNNDDDTSNNCSTDFPFLYSGNVLNYDAYQFGFYAGTIKLTFGECNGNGYLTMREAFDVNGSLVSSNTDLWKQDGDFLSTDSDNNGDYFSKIYKKNLQLGESWSHTRTSDGAIITHEVIDLDSLITVPAGTFHCKVLKYSNTAIINNSYIFWDDQVGNVMEDAEGFFKLELKEY